MSKKFAEHLWYRTSQGQLFLIKNNDIIAHACVAPRQPWIPIFFACKIKLPILQKSEKNLRALNLIWNYEIASFFVHPRHRKKGFGKTLLQKAIRYCRKKKIKSLSLFVNKKNLRAIRFYQKNSFFKTSQSNNKYIMKYSCFKKT